MKYGLLGKKLSHSMSKKIHEFIYDKLNLDDSYELIETNEEDLEIYINKLRTKEYAGFNVTIPYKISIMKYLDKISDEAKKIKACNTIYLENGLVVGCNTDYFGFIDSIKEFEVQNKKGYIMGSGGAALACLTALNDLGGKVSLIARNEQKAKLYCDDVTNFNNQNISGYFLINCTNFGMYPILEDSTLLDKNIINKFTWVYDCIYNPKETSLLKAFKKDSKKNGLDMLILQALYAFKIWKNIDLDFDYYLKIIKEALNE